jgi:hypothetical protein
VHVPFKNSAALLGAGAVFALGGCGGSATQSSTTSASTGASGAATQPQGRPGTPPATQLKSLADALGVSVDKLRAAMESASPAGDAVDVAAGRFAAPGWFAAPGRGAVRFDEPVLIAGTYHRATNRVLDESPGAPYRRCRRLGGSPPAADPLSLLPGPP